MCRLSFHSAAAGVLGVLVAFTAAPTAHAQRAPRGIYATIDISDYVKQQMSMGNTVNDMTVSAYYDSFLINSAVSGIDLEVHWDFAEPNPPPANGPLTAADLFLNYVTDTFTEAAKYGKTVKLDVTAGFNSPQWLLDHTQPTGLPSCDTLFTTGNAADGCGTVTFNYYGEATDQDTPNQTNQMLVLPLPWNSTYVAAWEAFLTVLAQQYGSNPVLVGVTMAGPTAASPEMIMPNNYNTCANPGANGVPPNQGAHQLCYTCPKGTDPPCNESNGMLAEDMWNTLFQSPKSTEGTTYPTNSDQAFVSQWMSTIQFYEGTFQNITLTITPGDGTGFPSFDSPENLPPTSGNVLYSPECLYSAGGGTTYANNNYATRSCDAASYLLTHFMNTAGGPGMNGIASQTSGMEAQSAAALGPPGNSTGDVGLPGIKFLAQYSSSVGPQNQLIGGAQFDHQVSDPMWTFAEGCPQGKNGCDGMLSVDQALYNVLQYFFLNTRGANRFGGSAVINYAPPGEPTPRYLEVLQQDIGYAQNPENAAPQAILDPMTGVNYQLSAQDMLNMAKASLLGHVLGHDLNEDGRSDIVWYDSGSGNLAAWLMNGNQILQSAAIGAVPNVWSLVGQRDFNGDGMADLLWRDSSGDLAIWLMNGSQVLQSAGVGNIPTVWSVAGIGDFNGDGKGDILWQDTSGNLAVWLLNGATVLFSGGLGNVPAIWSVVGVGDFNGDGMSDILWRDSNGNTSIWFMNGTTASSSASVGNIPTNWSVVGTGDFNGDGMSDIVWRDNLGNTSIWLMNGAAVSSAGGLGNVPTSWSIAETGDYNADGMTDLLWRDNLGNTSIWFMTGTTIASTGAVGNIPTNWIVQSTNAD
jgi:FG-GAP-like repeat